MKQYEDSGNELHVLLNNAGIQVSTNMPVGSAILTWQMQILAVQPCSALVHAAVGCAAGCDVHGGVN